MGHRDENCLSGKGQEVKLRLWPRSNLRSHHGNDFDCHSISAVSLTHPDYHVLSTNGVDTSPCGVDYNRAPFFWATRDLNREGIRNVRT